MNDSRPSLRRRVLLVAAGISVVLKFWLVSAQPVVAHANAGFDDRLYLELANHIVDGDWLGPYSQFTLMKGPMYPMFIAGAFWLGLPLPIAQHLLYLLGCVLLAFALKPLLKDWQLFAIFTLLWWQPMSYVVLDVLRQNIYTPLTLLLFAGLIALETQNQRRLAQRLVWGALLGISGAAFYLTREESIWVVPTAALLICMATWNSWRRGEWFRPLSTQLGCAIAFAAAIIASICILNYRDYGWFGTVEFRARQFLAAYGALQRPIPSRDVPYVPVTRETRLRLYEVSPAFAELKPSLEGMIGLEWATYSEFLTGRPAGDLEMSGGRFLWALRDAVVESGHAPDAKSALNFYDRIASEVNRACDEGRLGAVRKRRDSMVPPWKPEDTERLHSSAPGYCADFFLFRQFTAFPESSNGPIHLLRIFRELTRWPLAISDDAPEIALPLQSLANHWRLVVLQILGEFFRWICAPLALTGFGSWIWAGVRLLRALRRRRPV